MDDRFQNILDIESHLCRDPRCVVSLKSDHVLDLLRHTVRISARKVDLIDDRDNIKIMVKGKIHVCKRLGLDTLSRIYNKDRTVTRRKTSGYLIVKVNVTWGIDQIKDILLAVLCFVNRADCLGFDRDSALSLKIHIVKDLGLHLTAG